MGFSYKTNGVHINPGEQLSFPITAEESSVLDLQWNSIDDQELEFSLIFTPAEGGEESLLLPSQMLRTCQQKLDIKGPGSCVLQWRNCSGWFGGSVCKIAYTATLQSKSEIREKRRQLRQNARQNEITSLRVQIERTRGRLEETRMRVLQKDAVVGHILEAIASAEKARCSDVARASAIEQDMKAAIDALSDLTAEQEGWPEWQDGQESRFREWYSVRKSKESGKLLDSIENVLLEAEEFQKQKESTLMKEKVAEAQELREQVVALDGLDYMRKAAWHFIFEEDTVTSLSAQSG
jgi:hypothetical protein